MSGTFFYVMPDFDPIKPCQDKYNAELKDIEDTREVSERARGRRERKEASKKY
jgi:hypothetical protein